MDALLAIAALCSINGGMSTGAIEHKQLACQQHLVECYFGKVKTATGGVVGTTYFDPSAQGPVANKFLHECVLERKLKKVEPSEPNYGG